MPFEEHHLGVFRFLFQPKGVTGIAKSYSDFIGKYEARLRVARDLLPRLHLPLDTSLRQELMTLKKANNGLISSLNRLVQRADDSSSVLRERFSKFIQSEANSAISRIEPGYQKIAFAGIQTKITHLKDYLDLITRTVQQENEYIGANASVKEENLPRLAELINSELLVERNFKRVVLSLLQDLKFAAGVKSSDLPKPTDNIHIRIRNLDSSTVRGAVSLCDRIFPVQSADELAKVWFPASLDKKKFRAFYSQAGISEAKYWVATARDKVVGTIGLYCYEKDKQEAYWMGWLGVDPTYRGRGIGLKLVQFSIDEARKKGKKFIRLYTSDDPNEAKAQDLYDRFHFAIVNKEPGIGHPYNIVYRELRL